MLTAFSSKPDASATRTSDMSEDTPRQPTPSWKDEIAARVRARRANRSAEAQPSLPGMESAFSPQSVAARVAERYARLPSWREALAAETAQSTVHALAAAASTPLPAEPEPEQLSLAAELAPAELQTQPSAPEPCQADPLHYSVSVDSLPATPSTPPQAHAPTPRRIFDEDFLHDPLENAVVEPTLPLPASLIMTPRELVAPRKTRPRLAEGPLREEMERADPRAEGTQGADSAEDQRVSTSRRPAASSPSTGGQSAQTPPWNSIHLDTEGPIRERRMPATRASEQILYVASLEDRAMAALVDCALTLCAFLLFSGVFALSSTVLPHGRTALIAAGAALFVMAMLYQLLFFTLTDATPGMRYAKIALCTFDDENPSRSALRGRIAALLLSALPLGLGFLWAIFDEDSLGWHDRVTRTYQRSYRDE